MFFSPWIYKIYRFRRNFTNIFLCKSICNYAPAYLDGVKKYFSRLHTSFAIFPHVFFIWVRMCAYNFKFCMNISFRLWKQNNVHFFKCDILWFLLRIPVLSEEKRAIQNTQGHIKIGSDNNFHHGHVSQPCKREW